MDHVVGGLRGGAVGKEGFLREREVIDDDVAGRGGVRAQGADARGERFGRAAVRGEGERGARREIVDDLEHGAALVGIGRPRRRQARSTGVVWPSGLPGPGRSPLAMSSAAWSASGLPSAPLAAVSKLSEMTPTVMPVPS